MTSALEREGGHRKADKIREVQRILYHKLVLNAEGAMAAKSSEETEEAASVGLEASSWEVMGMEAVESS